MIWKSKTIICSGVLVRVLQQYYQQYCVLQLALYYYCCSASSAYQQGRLLSPACARGRASAPTAVVAVHWQQQYHYSYSSQLLATTTTTTTTTTASYFVYFKVVRSSKRKQEGSSGRTTYQLLQEYYYTYYRKQLPLLYIRRSSYWCSCTASQSIYSHSTATIYYTANAQYAATKARKDSHSFSSSTQPGATAICHYYALAMIDSVQEYRQPFLLSDYHDWCPKTVAVVHTNC